MTYTWNVNCHKWRNVGLIGAWVLATIGLGYSIYYTYGLVYPHNTEQIVEHCKDLPPGWKEDCMIRNSAPQDPIGLYIALFLNGCNFLGMWIVINTRYELIKVNCVSNNKFTDTLTEKSN